MNNTFSSFPISTFKILYELMQVEDKLEDIQVYSHKRQANILNDQGLSILNIVFYPEEDKVTVFHCDTPGYCNYDKPYHFDIHANMMISCMYVLSSVYLVK